MSIVYRGTKFTPGSPLGRGSISFEPTDLESAGHPCAESWLRAQSKILNVLLFPFREGTPICVPLLPKPRREPTPAYPRPARGRKGGRPKGVDERKKKAAIALKKEPERSIKDICEIVGISRNTYYKYTRPDDSPKPSGKSGK